MGLSSSLANEGAALVLDASVIINLNATGCALDIVKAIPNKMKLVRNVVQELEPASGHGRQDGKFVMDLIAAGYFEIVDLDGGAANDFAGLVAGHAAATLDDGEAATIAHAIHCGGIAVIDERKANRICAERFSALQVACTTELFMHPKVLKAIGRKKLADAVGKALELARMRVLPAHVEWVIDLIGSERAQSCTSIPRHIRQIEGSHARKPKG